MSDADVVPAAGGARGAGTARSHVSDHMGSAAPTKLASTLPRTIGIGPAVPAKGLLAHHWIVQVSVLYFATTSGTPTTEPPRPCSGAAFKLWVAPGNAGEAHTSRNDRLLAGIDPLGRRRTGGIFGPRVPRVPAAQLGPHLGVAGTPEGGEVPGHRDRVPGRREQV